MPSGGAFSFDALLQRIHPAASRVKKLAVETPALLIVFDLLLGADGKPLIDLPLQRAPRASSKRSRSSTFADSAHPAVAGDHEARATPKAGSSASAPRSTASSPSGAISPYRSGDRTGMQKIKNYRSADCVVGGFRYNEGKPVVGSLLLGLYDDDGLLHHVGFTSTIKREEKPALTAKLETADRAARLHRQRAGRPEPLVDQALGEWQPLKPKLVVEVCYDHFTGDRFRHGTSCCAGGPTRRRGNARWSRSSRRRRI